MAESPTEDFVQWLLQARFEDVVERLEEMTEGERRKLAKGVAAAWRIPSQDARLALAVLGVCAWSEARRVRLWSVGWHDQGPFAEAMQRVFAARRPDWIDRWVERELAEGSGTWSVIRGLVRAGVCAHPSSDVYVIRMISSKLGSWGSGRTLLQTLEADPGLLEEEIWRAFEIDPPNGNLFQDDGVDWGAGPGQHSWEQALCQLAEQGRLDRSRLLEASTEALRQGIQLKGTGFHVRLHEQLAPMPAERGRLAPAYLDLLNHRVDAVAGFALRQLKLLVDEGKGDGRTLVERLPAALERETKGPALAALKLLRKLVKDDRALALPAGMAAVRGLGHRQAEIPEKVLDFLEWLESVAGAPAPELAAALSDLIERIPPSQRGRAEELLAKISPAVLPARDPAPARPAAEDWDVLCAAAAALTPRLRALAGIDELLCAVRSGELPPPWIPPAAALPRLDPASAVSPIASLDELIDALLAFLENPADAVELERILDGLCRFGGERPADFQQRTAALLQRAGKLKPSGGGDGWSFVSEILAGLVVTWLGGPPPRRPIGLGPRYSPRPEHFLLARVEEIEHFCRDLSEGLLDRSQGLLDSSQRLLALPTHRGGWIDPRVLVERVRRREETATPCGELDLLQALLRLAPEGREEALARAAGLAGEIGAVVRFALGAAFGAAESPSPSWPLWIAAGRARAPFGVVAELAGTPVADEAFAVRPPVYRWRVQMEKTADYMPATPTATVDTEPPAAPQTSHRPLALFCGRRDWSQSLADARYRQHIWPMDPTLTFIAGCAAVAIRLFSPSSAYSPTAVHLEPLFAPEQPFPELAQLLLGLTLVTQDADARTLAVDLAVELMADGRCRGDELGRIYAVLLHQEGILKLGRVAAAVEQIAPHGPLQTHACLRWLEERLAAAGEPPRDLHHLLAPYRELLTTLGQRCAPRLQPLLAGIGGTGGTGGTGKAARLARQILEQAGDADLAATRRRLAGQELLRVRLERARIWGARLGEGGGS